MERRRAIVAIRSKININVVPRYHTARYVTVFFQFCVFFSIIINKDYVLKCSISLNSLLQYDMGMACLSLNRSSF